MELAASWAGKDVSKLKPASKSILPSPEGPLSREVPSSHIDAANQKSSAPKSEKKRGTYVKYSPKESHIIRKLYYIDTKYS